MNVEIIDHSQNPIETIYRAFRICYSKDLPTEIKIPTIETSIGDVPDTQKMIDFIKKHMNHESPIEHVSFTFAIEGVSRITEQQLTRHRIGASYSIKSGRYCEFGDKTPIELKLPLSNNKYRNGHCKFSINQEEYLAKLYDNEMSCSQIANLYDSSRDTILKIIKNYTNSRNNSESRFINKNYFDNIDSEIKAYILGFILTDGCITIDKSGHKRIVIEQLKEEQYLLNNIISELKKNGEINSSGHNSSCKIQIANDCLCDKLISLGITPNKSLTMNIDKIAKNTPKIYYKDLIRGIIDANGSLNFNKNGYVYFNLIGTPSIINFVSSYFKENLSIKMDYSYIYNDKKTPQLQRIIINKKDIIGNIISLIYNNFNVNFFHTRKIRTVLKMDKTINDQFKNNIKLEFLKKGIIIPPTVLNDYEATLLFIQNIKIIEKTYKTLILKGVPKEDARYIMPQGQATNIIMTMNARELIHFMQERLCIRAQWEIRELAEEIRKQVNEILPIFNKNDIMKCGKTCWNCKEKANE